MSHQSSNHLWLLKSCWVTLSHAGRWCKTCQSSATWGTGMMHAKLLQSCLTLWDPMDCSPPDSSAHGDSPGKDTGVGCHALDQGIVPIQGLNSRLISPAMAGGFFTTSTNWEAGKEEICTPTSIKHWLGANTQEEEASNRSRVQGESQMFALGSHLGMWSNNTKGIQAGCQQHQWQSGDLPEYIRSSWFGPNSQGVNYKQSQILRFGNAWNYSWWLLLLWQVKVLVTQLCLILWDPMDCRLPTSSVHGILQAKLLEWVAIVFQLLSHVWLCDPMNSRMPGFPSFTIFWSLLKHMSMSWWYHPTISFSVAFFSSCPQPFPASGSFPMSRLFASQGLPLWLSW